MNTFLRIAKIICVLVLVCLPCIVSSQSKSNENWWEDNTLVVTSYSPPPQNILNVNQARSWSRREALENVQHQMIEKIKDIYITADMTVGAGIASGEIEESRLVELVKGTKIFSEEFGMDNSCTIVMKIPVYGGADSVASLILKPVEKEDFPEPTFKTKTKGNYTGLIIDCGDLELDPVLAPTIQNADKKSIYSYNNLEYEKVVANGMIAYAKEDKPEKDGKTLLLTLGKLNLNNFIFSNAYAAKNNKSRAGDNPLVIKAKVVTDGNSTPVISVSDANRILSENQATHFLDEGSVVFTGYRIGGVRA